MKVLARRDILKTAALGCASVAMGQTAMANVNPPFLVPPEEEPHELTFMQWPVSRKVHRDPVFLDMLQQTIADIVNAISEFEPCLLYTSPSPRDS